MQGIDLDGPRASEHANGRLGRFATDRKEDPQGE
jgi:hypothetical protein